MLLENALNSAAKRLAKRAGKKLSREAAATEAHYGVCVLLIYTQIVLHSALVGLPTAGPAQWWLMLLQFIPASGLFLLIRLVFRLYPGQTLAGAFQKSFGKVGSGLAMGLYGLLLLADAWFNLYALVDVVAAYVINRPQYVSIGLAVVVTALASVLAGGVDGTERMVFLFMKPLAALLVLAAFAAFQKGNIANLYPYMGAGREMVFRSFLSGCGASWPVVLMGFKVKPQGEDASSGFKWLAAAIVAIALPVLCYCYVQPYGVLMAPEALSARLVGFLRASPSKVIWELFLIHAMVLFLCAICAGLAVFSSIAAKGLKKKARRGFFTLGFGVVLAGLSAWHADSLLEVFKLIMPWRYLAAVLPLLATCVIGFIKKKVRV
jgi:Spore germination protein.